MQWGNIYLCAKVGAFVWKFVLKFIYLLVDSDVVVFMTPGTQGKEPDKEEILKWVGMKKDGMSYRDISKDVGWNAGTINKHVKNILKKEGVTMLDDNNDETDDAKVDGDEADGDKLKKNHSTPPEGGFFKGETDKVDKLEEILKQIGVNESLSHLIVSSYEDTPLYQTPAGFFNFLSSFANISKNAIKLPEAKIITERLFGSNVAETQAETQPMVFQQPYQMGMYQQPVIPPYSMGQQYPPQTVQQVPNYMPPQPQYQYQQPPATNTLPPKNEGISRDEMEDIVERKAKDNEVKELKESVEKLVQAITKGGAMGGGGDRYIERPFLGEDGKPIKDPDDGKVLYEKVPADSAESATSVQDNKLVETLEKLVEKMDDRKEDKQTRLLEEILKKPSDAGGDSGAAKRDRELERELAAQKDKSLRIELRAENDRIMQEQNTKHTIEMARVEDRIGTIGRGLDGDDMSDNTRVAIAEIQQTGQIQTALLKNTNTNVGKIIDVIGAAVGGQAPARKAKKTKNVPQWTDDELKEAQSILEDD